MSMTGADAERLEAAAAAMRRAADELDEHSSVVRRTLAGVEWLGNVATAFREIWNGRHQAQLSSTATFIRDAAGQLDANAAQQREASGAASAGPLVTRPTDDPPRLATPAEIRAAIDGARVPAITARRSLPGAAARLDAWAAELATGEHTTAELQGFLKFKEMVLLANGLRATVGTAAESSFEAQRSAVEAGASAVLSILVPGDEAANPLQAMADSAAEGVVDDSLADFRGLAAQGLEAQSALMIRQAYEARADAYLVAAEQSFRTTQNGSDFDAAMVRRNGVNEYLGNYQVAVAEGEVANAFDLGPSVLTAPLAAGMDVLVPKSGTATFALLDSAQAGFHGKAALAFMSVATDASMFQLELSMMSMGL